MRPASPVSSARLSHLGTPVEIEARAEPPRPEARPDATEAQQPRRALPSTPSSTSARTSGGAAQLTRRLALQPLPLPATPKVHLVEQKHGQLVADPYRWLEMPATQSQAVVPHQAHRIQTWVDAQNARTEQFLNQHAPLRAWLQERYLQLVDRPSVGSVSIVRGLGGVQWRRDAGGTRQLHLDRALTKLPEPADAAQTTLFPVGSPRLAGEVLVDERALAKKLGLAPSSFVADTRFSPDGKHLALAYGEYHGDDRRKIVVVNTTTGEPTGEILTGAKWGQLMWLDEKRFVYGKVALSEQALAGNAADVDHRQMLHTVGSAQSADVELFAQDREPWVHSTLWRDGDRLYRQRAKVGTSHVVIESASFNVDDVALGRTQFFPLYAGEGIEDLVGEIPGTSRYLLQTKRGEARTGASGELAYVDLHDPARELHTLIPAVPGREIEGVAFADDTLVVDFQVNLGHRLAVYGFDGELRREIDLQEAGLPSGTIRSMHYDDHAEKLVVTYAAPLTPARDYEVSLETGEVQAKPQEFPIPFDAERFTMEQVSYRSKDGTEIPMQLIRSKEAASGRQPTLLYGYGGFEYDAAAHDFVSASLIPFLEAGGTLALPALRGGAELGDAWHAAGMRENKQRVFDDFIGAAEYLVAQGITSRDELAIMGASNGGLLVGAAITQRPELFKAAVPHAGVMDMARFAEFSSGRWWVDEYGDPNDAEDFATMIRYSPVHNTRDASYPAVLVTTGRYDSRVDPSHSLKFLAGLQEHQKGQAPILGFVNPDSGHWPNRHPTRQAEFLSLQMAFIMSQLGMKAPSP